MLDDKLISVLKDEKDVAKITYFLKSDISDRIKAALIKKLINELKPFRPETKITLCKNTVIYKLKSINR